IPQDETNIAGGAGIEGGRAVQQSDLGFDLGGSRMKMNRGAMLQRFGRWEEVEAAIHLADSLKAAGLGKHVAARQLAQLDIRQVQRGALPRYGPLGFRPVDLDPSHAQAPPRGVEFD